MGNKLCFFQVVISTCINSIEMKNKFIQIQKKFTFYGLVSQDYQGSDLDVKPLLNLEILRENGGS